MKKIKLIMLMVFLNFAFFSCEPEVLNESVTPIAQENECCGEDGDLPPPPPPPPGEGG